MNKLVRVFTFLFLALTNLVFAETAVAPVAKQPEITETGVLIFTASSMLIIILGILIYMLYLLNSLAHVYNATADKSAKLSVFKMVDHVPIELEHEILMAHEYDGIRELDNKMPTWWLYMFYCTIIFSFIYLYIYHIKGDGNIQAKEYEVEMIKAEEEQKLMAEKVNETSVTMVTDKARLEKGAAVFQKSCTACHGKLGEGGVGPNLTDDYWLHGGDIKSVFKTIKYGVPSKGMISWQTQLGASQIQDVASYISTLKGTNPPNGKEPQGELVNSR